MNKPRKIRVENTSIHMGDLLRKLSEWDGGTQVQFAAKFNRSDKWLQLAFKDERLSSKNIERICKAIGIPKEYFDGKYDLPTTAIAEPSASYSTRMKELEKTLQNLKDDNRNLLQELRSAHKKIILLYEEKEGTISDKQ